jgi:broad specificity phosphatase PhoE
LNAARSASTRLLLVRHGEDADNSHSIINGRRDAPLTDLGRSQAAAIADDLQSETIGCVYASPLQRAHQTASIIADRLGIKDLHIHPDLVERDYGILTGRPVSDIPILAGRLFVSHGFKHVIQANGIEEYADLWARAGLVLRAIREQHRGETVLVVAHNEILRMMRANAMQRPWEDELLRAPMGHCQLIAIDMA